MLDAVELFEHPQRVLRIRDHLLTTVDLTATFILALEFALAAVRANLDLFGILVLATVGATGGGIMRDLLLGEQPPAALRDWRYVAIAWAAALTIIVAGVLSDGIGSWTPPVLLDMIEAAGLAFATVAGAQKAIDYKLNAASVAILAVVGSCGGGILRDVLTAQVPHVLRADFYATAALIGAGVMVFMVRRLSVRQPIAAAITGVLVLTLRIVALAGGWNLPHLR